MGVLIVPLLHVCQHFLVGSVDALGLILLPAAGGACLRAGSQEDLHRSVRQHHRADVPAIHQHILLFGHAALQVQQKCPHGGVCTYGRGCHTRGFGADGGAHVLVLQVDVLLARNGGQPQLDFRQQGIHRRVVLGVLARAQGVQADGAVHCTGVHIDIAQLCRQTACQSGFACTRRPIDRNRYHDMFSLLYIIVHGNGLHCFFTGYLQSSVQCRKQSADYSRRCRRPRPAPRPQSTAPAPFCSAWSWGLPPAPIRRRW